MIVKPLHWTRGVLRSPAVAFKLNHSHAPVVDNTLSRSEDGVQRCRGDPSPELSLLRARLTEGAVGSETVSLAPPQDILTTLRELHSRHPSRCTKHHLRIHGSAHLVPYLRHPHRAPGLVLYLLELKEPDFALWVLRLANEIGYNFSPKFYIHLANVLAMQQSWRGILRLASLARVNLGYTTTALLNWRLQALAEIPHVVPIEEALALFQKEGVRASRMTYHILISMHLRNHDFASALAALHAMESSGFAVIDETCAVVLLGYRAFGLTPDIKAQALTTLDKTTDDKVASTFLNGLIQLMLDADDMAGVIELLTSVSQRPEDPSSGLGVDTILGGDVIGDTPGATSSPSPMTYLRDIIDLDTYNKLLDHLAQRGDIPRAMHVLGQMRAAEVQPDSHTAASLIRLYFAAGHANDALHVVASVLVDSPKALTLLSSLGYVSSVLPRHPIPPPAPPHGRVFNALLRGILKDYKLSGLRTVLTMMRITGISVDMNTLTILLSYKQRHERANSREMIRIVRILMSFGVAPTMRHLHILLHTLSTRSREVAHSRGWHTAAPPEGSESADEPIVRTAEHFLPGAGITFPHHRKYGNLIRPVLQSLADRGVRSDRVTFALRIKHDALVEHDMEAATNTFRTMVDSGLQPNIYHYGALMEGHAAAGDMDTGEALMREAVDAGLKADVKTHTILISGWARRAQPSMAVKAFRNMVAQGIRPDVPAIDALVSAFFRAKAYGVARRVLLRLWPQIGSLTDEHVEMPLRELARAFRALHLPNTSVRDKLSYSEQQALRNTIREISRTWQDVRRKGLSRSRSRKHHAHDVMPRNPKYTTALGG